MLKLDETKGTVLRCKSWMRYISRTQLKPSMSQLKHNSHDTVLLKKQCNEKSLQTETVWGVGWLGSKDVSDPNFIVLLCPFNLLRRYGAHQRKTEFMLGPAGQGVNLTFDTCISQLRLLQPACSVRIRNMIYFRVKDLRKLEDYEIDILIPAFVLGC